MNPSKRRALKTGGGLGLLGLLASVGMISPTQALAAWNQTAFDAKDINAALTALGATGAANSADITLLVPDIAENGAVVPMGVNSKLANIESIAILIEKNPSPLAALFNMASNTEASVQTRCKMGQTSDVIALVKADGKFFTSRKEVKVTLGGCGG